MNTVALNNNGKKKKLIELPVDTCRKLAIQAAAMGTSVKRLIENMIISSVDQDIDESIYKYLCKNFPDGDIMLSDTEQNDLMQRLRIKVSNNGI